MAEKGQMLCCARQGGGAVVSPWLPQPGPVCKMAPLPPQDTGAYGSLNTVPDLGQKGDAQLLRLQEQSPAAEGPPPGKSQGWGSRSA